MRLSKTLLASTLLLAPLAAQAQQVDGFYIGAGAGVNWLQDANIAATGQLADTLRARGNAVGGDVSFDMGWVGVVSLGYGFGNGLRAEIEGSYRENEVDSISGFRGAGTVRASGTARSYGVMANALYDFDIGANFGGFSLLPYVGAGAGYIWREFDDVRANVLGGTVSSDGTDGRFAYQAIVGASVPLTQYAPGLAFTAEYRFLGTMEHDVDTSSGGGSFAVARTGTKSENYNHSILIGLRYAFGQTPPPPVVSPVAPAPAPAAAPAPARTYLVFFDFDRADLTDRARQIISEAARNATRPGVTRIEVAGHADRSGTPQYNQRLSERRASAVATELERQGIQRSNISVQAFGESRPLVPTADGVREPQNRRVEIVLR
ncbi:OmpA family protein [Falsiroseomonas selenitidurans]|uniref:OmpA family protein n=1 Tax=Falsiroseomonas selenitidurans TaxID=2716335 RepID=A0ABX1EBB7_9PROT|nr:OmpA family protein [Falsiroseomonas selenitidurans]NKC34116.1 OmpA family protein [Falsiroseomonas selenitidurans]